MIMSADHVIDMGPGAGRHGGLVVAHGNPEGSDEIRILLHLHILNNKRKFHIPRKEKKRKWKVSYTYMELRAITLIM